MPGINPDAVRMAENQAASLEEETFDLGGMDLRDLGKVDPEVTVEDVQKQRNGPGSSVPEEILKGLLYDELKSIKSTLHEQGLILPTLVEGLGSLRAAFQDQGKLLGELTKIVIAGNESMDAAREALESRGDAVRGEILAELWRIHRLLDARPVVSEAPPAAPPSKAGKPFNFAFNFDTELSTRTANALSRAGIVTLETLITWTEGDLLKLKGFGDTALAEVQKILQERGLKLAPAGTYAAGSTLPSDDGAVTGSPEPEAPKEPERLSFTQDETALKLIRNTARTVKTAYPAGEFAAFLAGQINKAPRFGNLSATPDSMEEFLWSEGFVDAQGKMTIQG